MGGAPVVAGAQVSALIREAVTFLGSTDPGPLSGQRLARLQSQVALYREVGKARGIPAALLAAVAWTESDFVDTARNASTGAAGLMQIHPMNFAAYGLTANPVDRKLNIDAGARDLLAKGYGVKPLLATIAGYNGFKSYTDPVKLAAFTQYYRVIAARWFYLTLTGAL